MSKAKVPSWFKESLVNLIVDYYPEVQFRPYGSGATPENVLPVLRRLKPGYIIIYAKGHSGYTTYPSRLHTQHVMLARDMPAAFRDMTRRTGTRLFLYYSGLLDGIAGLRNPQWRMRNRDGQTEEMFKDFENLLSYSLCPLSEYWDEWASVQVRELIQRSDPDGFWIDGDWPGPCYCPRCEARFRKESGYKGPMPPAEGSTPEGAAWLRTWAGIMHEWRTRFAAFIKSLKGDCLYSAGNVSPRREFLAPFDWRSGDFFSPNNHRLTMSHMMRWYTTLGVPYDAFVCDTSFVHSRRHIRSRSKPTARMLQEAVTICANGGTLGYWTYPMPNGAFVPSRMARAVKVAEYVRRRQDVFRGTRGLPWTGIVATEPALWMVGSGGVQGAGKALIALHRSPEVMDETGLADDMPHELLVLPEQSVLDARSAAKLERYVRRGGRLLTSGSSIVSPAIQRMLGVRLVRRGALREGHVLTRTGEDPAGVLAPWDELELAGGRELYPLYLSWDQFNPEQRKLNDNWPMHGMLDEEAPQPAGFPAAVIRKLGAGTIVHVATEIFAQYLRLGDPQMLVWLREIVAALDPAPLFASDALSFMEFALRVKDGALLVHVINGNPGRDISLVGTEDLWVDDIAPTGPIKLWIRCRRKPKFVTWEPEGRPAKTSWERGTLEVVLPRLEIHACLKVEGFRRG